MPLKRDFLPVLLLISFISCSRGGFFSNGKIPVTVENVYVEEKNMTLAYPAILEPSEEVSYQFPIDIRIASAPVSLGDIVALGDILFQMEEQDFTLRANQLKTELMEREALLEKNGYFLKNRDRLLDEGKIDQSMYDTLEAEVNALNGEVERLKADIALLEHQVQGAVVSAPFAGVVVEKKMTSGTLAPAKTILLRLVKTDPMHLVFEINPKEAPFVSAGMEIKVRIEDLKNQVFPGSIFFVSPEISAGGDLLKIMARIPNPTQTLKGKMRGEVNFVSPKKIKKMSIPTVALQADGSKEYVYIVREGKAWRIRVYTRKDPNNPEWTEILEGIRETDVVVTEGAEKLKTGAEVNLWR